MIRSIDDLMNVIQWFFLKKERISGHLKDSVQFKD